MPRPRYPKIEFDEIQMYFGRPYVIDIEDAVGIVTVYAPQMKFIIETGQKKFNETLNIFTTNTTAYKLLLWENGIDWCELKDFELFCMLYKNINYSVSSLLFGDLDFSKFELRNKKIDDEHEILTLWNEEWFINAERQKIHNAEALKKENESFSIQPLISACVNHPGFKYKLSEVEEMNVFEFYDSVKRLQIYENATACLKGLFSGFVDGSKISADQYNFMKEI